MHESFSDGKAAGVLGVDHETSTSRIVDRGSKAYCRGTSDGLTVSKARCNGSWFLPTLLVSLIPDWQLSRRTIRLGLSCRQKGGGLARRRPRRFLFQHLRHVLEDASIPLPGRALRKAIFVHHLFNMGQRETFLHRRNPLVQIDPFVRHSHPPL